MLSGLILDVAADVSRVILTHVDSDCGELPWQTEKRRKMKKPKQDFHKGHFGISNQILITNIQKIIDLSFS